MKLTILEKRFLDEVLNELKQYQISPTQRNNIKQQLLEHIQESRENGQDSMNELGDASTFVKDYLEVNGIDLHAEIKHMRKSKARPAMLWAIGLLSFFVSYLAIQLILSMFLTDSMNPLNTSRSFNYNIFYQISGNAWWNFSLMFISISGSLLVTMFVLFYIRKRYNRR